MSSKLIERMRERLADVNNPDKDYSLDDFNQEFANVGRGEGHGLFKLQIEFANKSNNPDPDYATNGSSGFDLRANIDKPVVLKPLERAIIPTGLFFQLPDNTEIQVRPRSGLAAKNGITVLNTPGTIDADYRGEIKVILINLGESDFKVMHGDRIAQAVIASCISKNIVSFNKLEDLTTDTQRGAGGFGSTGHL